MAGETGFYKMKTDYPPTQTVCIIGHRPDRLGGYSENPIQDWVRDRLADQIYKVFHSGYRQFICCGAQGTDWIAAEEVLGLKENYPEVVLSLALPFKGYNSKWPEWVIEKFESQILEKSDKVHYISDPSYAGWKMQKRNEWAVDRAGLVVAVYGGGKGGTHNGLEYAFRVGKEIYGIDPIQKTAKMIAEWKPVTFEKYQGKWRGKIQDS